MQRLGIRIQIPTDLTVQSRQGSLNYLIGKIVVSMQWVIAVDLEDIFLFLLLSPKQATADPEKMQLVEDGNSIYLVSLRRNKLKCECTQVPFQAIFLFS